jgi:hypothetical protein
LTLDEVTDMNEQVIERLEAKSPEQRFLYVLQREFHQAPKVAQALLDEAQSCLVGASDQLRPGQMRVLLARRQAGHGQALCDTATTEVIWTLDAGAEDRRILRQHGSTALRRVRIQRLLDEAIEQGGVGTQEDLAQVLQVSVRTIKRDYAHLRAQGIHLPSRGYVHAIGRGQTHKARIVRRWLCGETYDQIALHTHHSIPSIQRYVQAFVRVVELQRRGFSEGQIGLLLQMSLPLVRQYLAVQRENDTPGCRERLEEQLQRLNRGSGPRHKRQKGAL